MVDINVNKETMKTTFNTGLWITIGIIFIVLTIIANFPEISFEVLGKKTVIRLIPLAIQLMLKFIMNVAAFFALVTFIIVFHIYIIRKIIDIAKMLQKSIDDIIAWLDRI